MNHLIGRFGVLQRARVAAVIGLLLFLAALATAYDAVPTSWVPSGGRIVILDVVTGERAPVRLSIREEARATVAVTDGPTLELASKINGEVLELAVIEVVAGEGTAGETRRALSVLRLSKGTATTLDVGSTALTLTWIDQRDPTGAGPAVSERCTECCITCQDVTYCACLVQTTCGRCCCGDCCSIVWGPGLRRMW
jgi:hypothetical protein